jgi:FKBP-type peptidyl-prolyl cis-trans isomerase FklB
MNKHSALVIVVTLVWAGHALALDLDDDTKRFSYMIGMQIGQQLKNDHIELDEAAFLAAIKDAASGAEPQLSPQEMQATMQRIQQQRAAAAQALGEQNRIAGQQFLAANKDKEGVKELPSGLQYRVIQAGTGASPKATDTVEVHYRGTLIDGTEFDSSYSRGEPATFPVNGVIKGWQEALQVMHEGAKWQIVVPSELAYGSRGAGALIGPNATLIFDVELLKINN